MQTKIIRIGNSLGLRYKKAELDRLGIKEGDQVEVIIAKKSQPDTKKALDALRELSKLNTFSHIKDPVAWQREIRSEWDERERKQHDIT